MNSSSLQLASILVARFLRSNDYTQTLDAFIREAGLPPDAGQVSGRAGSSSVDGWTIEGVIEEKKAFDQSLKFERYGEGDDGQEEKWSVPGKLGSSALTVFKIDFTPHILSLLCCEDWILSADLLYIHFLIDCTPRVYCCHSFLSVFLFLFFSATGFAFDL